jgi:hypothetical protein
MLAPLAASIVPVAKVMCLGVFHFSNPGLDAAKMEVQDILGPKRQVEVREVVEQLRKFRPTKIAIERIPSAQSSIDENYQQYVNGKRTLAVDEIEQVGFRLASLGKHTQLYAIDHHQDLDFEAPFQFLAKHKPKAAEEFSNLITNIGKACSEVDRKYTLSQVLSIYNTREAELQNHRFYVKLAEYSDGKSYPGADMLSIWYQRNVRIYTNLRQVIEPGDRVLVIFGAGHIKILNDLISESGDLELVRPGKYLTKPPLPKLPLDL